MQEGILENSENVPVSNTNILLEEGIDPVNNQEENNNHPRRNWRKRLKVGHATNDSTVVQNDKLEDGENLLIENTERLPEKRVIAEDRFYDKKNNKSSLLREKIRTRKAADGIVVTQQEILDANIPKDIATENDLNEHNNKSKCPGWKMRGSKAAHCNMNESKEILEDSENYLIPNT